MRPSIVAILVINLWHACRFDGRLTMVDLNEQDNLNTLTLESRQSIWIPKVIFYNTEIKSESIDDDKAFASVHRAGLYRRRNTTYLHNGYLYSGKDNPITLSRVYSDKFICEYDMRVYPFDKQACTAIFILKGNAGSFVELVPSMIKYLGPIDLPQYYVMNATIQSIAVPPNITAVEVKIMFGRRLLSTMLTSYLPTFIICLVSFTTSYFKSFYFEAIATVNLTALLSLTTLFIGVTNLLPKTSYIKMIDVWLISCLTVPFCQVVLQVCHFSPLMLHWKQCFPAFPFLHL